MRKLKTEGCNVHAILFRTKFEITTLILEPSNNENLDDRVKVRQKGDCAVLCTHSSQEDIAVDVI
jgi:hypothetical protein